MGNAAYGDGEMQVDSRLYSASLSKSRAESLAFFTSALPPLGWTPRADVVLGGSLGQAWRRGDQRLTIAVVEVEESRMIVVLLSTPHH